MSVHHDSQAPVRKGYRKGGHKDARDLNFRLALQTVNGKAPDYWPLNERSAVAIVGREIGPLFSWLMGGRG